MDRAPVGSNLSEVLQLTDRPPEVLGSSPRPPIFSCLAARGILPEQLCGLTPAE